MYKYNKEIRFIRKGPNSFLKAPRKPEEPANGFINQKICFKVSVSSASLRSRQSVPLLQSSSESAVLGCPRHRPHNQPAA